VCPLLVTVTAVPRPLKILRSQRGAVDWEFEAEVFQWRGPAPYFFVGDTRACRMTSCTRCRPAI